jgi:uncharacterized protein with beta-barrel porin domain
VFGEMGYSMAMRAAIGANVTLGVSYDGQLGSGFTDHGVRGNISVKF